MEKKSNQWSLDRAFNLSKKNEERLRGILSCVKDIKEGNKTIDEAMKEATDQGWLTGRARDGYERSTATLLRSIGLITQNEYETTEVADAFVMKDISYSEMLILQLTKKEFKLDDESEIVHPFLVTLKTLLLLQEKDPNQGWIDSYDYLYFLTELKSMEDIEDMVSNIINKREKEDRKVEYKKDHDFDMWSSAFLSTGLIVEKEEISTPNKFEVKYELKSSEIDFIEWLVDDEQLDKIKNIEEFTRDEVKRDGVLKEFGKLNGGMVEVIPKVNLSDEYNIDNIETCDRTILFLYLFEGVSLKKIEERIFGVKDSASVGYFTTLILDSYGVRGEEHKGIWKAFANYPSILKIALKEINNTKLYSALFSDSEEDENLDKYKKAAAYLKKYAACHDIDLNKDLSENLEWKESFEKKFAPSQLKSIKKGSLLKKLFITDAKTNDSLAYWLAYHDNWGRCPMLNLHHFGVLQSDGQWYVQENKVSHEEAYEEGNRIRNILVESAALIETMKLNSIYDYELLDSKLQKILGEDYYKKGWIIKYLAILYPDKIACFYTVEWMLRVLENLKINPIDKEKRFLLNGQVSLIIQQTGWTYPSFWNVYYNHFGKNTKTFYKVGNHIDGSKNDFTDQTGEWKEKPYIAIGWTNVKDLSKYDDIKEYIKENYKKLNFLTDKPANHRSKKAGEIQCFYSIGHPDKNEEPIAVVADGGNLKYLVDDLQEYSFHNKWDGHRIDGSIHECFLDEDRLVNSNGYTQVTCKKIDDEPNRKYLLDLYNYHLGEYENRRSFQKWIYSSGLYNDEQASRIIESLKCIIFDEYIVKKSIFAYTSKKKVNIEIEKYKDEINYGIDVNNNKEKIGALKLYLRFLNQKHKKEVIELNYSDNNYKNNNAKNRVMFGAPGTGKSYQLKKECDNLVEDASDYERVTFHPDYMYSQFVGAYKPYMDGSDIMYEFVPGPFMRVLTKALKNLNSEEATRPFVLIIEEINRANVAAVFGDIFQLLDRDEMGTSEYAIEASEEIKDYLAKVFDADPSSFDKIQIPNNMFVWATMNSADQGVFPMDTAFKRRWNFEYLNIDNNENEIEKYEVYINENQQKINWNILRKSINEKLISLEINEDKLIGPFFIDKDVLENKENNYQEFNETFKNKVLMYLFEDAAKQKRTYLFNDDIAEKNQILFSNICDYYDKNGLKVFSKDISEKFLDEE